MKTTGGVLLATGLGNACSGGGNAPTLTGSLRVLVTGLDPGATTGGQVAITALDVGGFAPVTLALPPSGDSGDIPDIPVGTYRLTYTAPANHSLAVLEVNPQDVAVRAGTQSTLSWAVVVAQGTLRITVTGLGTSVASGGSTSIQRTDVANQSPVLRSIPASGSTDVGVAVGTYAISYTAPNGYSLNQGVQNPQNETVTAGQVAVATFGVVAVGFPTPDILNNASFESGWEGFTNGGSVDPTGVTRDTLHAYDGVYSVEKQLPVTSGSDSSSAFYYIFSNRGTFDRLWARFYFYFDAAITGTLKLQRWEDPSFSSLLGGFFCTGGNIGWGFDREWSAVITPLVALSSLVNGWHSLECDYWRNGDPSGYPSVAIWLDGNQLNGGLQSPPSPGAWTNGRLNAGQRGSSAQLGVYFLLNVLNGTPNNTVAGNVWVDRIAVSSVGRIGP